ncbi:MAG: tipN [Asticcacaulis sp.]|uniref:tipN n=1 Tax=Asticcacaulis sp. TaxID=1872648 RepID=UPI0039E61DCC
MKPPRTPQTPSEPKLNLFGRPKLRPLFDEPAAPAATDSQAKAGANDIMEAPFDNPTHVAPDAKPEPLPEDNGPEPSATFDTSLDIPEPAPVPLTELKPPPETTPPVVKNSDAPAKSSTHRSHRRSSRDLSPQKTRSEPVTRKNEASPVLVWGLATFASLLWACGLAAFALGAQADLAALTYEPFRIVVLACLALFPIGLIFATALALRHATRLSNQAQRTAELADALLAPAATAAHQTGDLVTALREQVDHAVRAVRLAHADITELSAQLKNETERLTAAAENARAATQNITQSLHHEREAIGALNETLGTQTTGIIEAVDRQARMVADASDLAQAQLREAEASLAASTGAIVNAAADVADVARTASEDLDRQTVRLETAGTGVADQVRNVEEGLSQQRAGLVSAALSLRADQEDFAVHIENQRAQLTEALSITRVATIDLGETSARGIDVLRDIVVSAQEHFNAVQGAAENERTAFETRIHATLSNISLMAADARDDLVEETRKALEQLNTSAEDAKRAADQAAQTAQIRVDRLNESIFEASKKADEVFDSRFAAARRLIEDSADLIGEAGDQTAQKLDASFAHTRDTIAEVNAALNDLANGADQLPTMAQARIAEIRQSVEDGINAMLEAARKAAQETEAVDTAFQDRVKRNYDMLTEAVRLMGVISGDQTLPHPPAEPAAPRDRGLTPRRAIERAADKVAEMTPPPVSSPVSPPVPPASVTRPRLSRLSMPASETRPSPGPEATPAPAPAPRETARPAARSVQEGWSWRELLGGMEGRERAAPVEAAPVPEIAPETAAEPPHDPEFDSLDDLMIAEVNAMGVDAAALLSRARIEEVIGAIMAEDNEGARLVVRRVAPAAIRRLSRRLLSDPQVRQHANDFATFYDQQINMALLGKDVIKGLNEVLASDSGRAYLLLDAALSDLI